jgi:hypothetical protein
LVRDPSTWKNWEGFYALSYTGLSKEEEGPYLTRQGFADHLTALREAGYVPLIPEDIVAFYRGEHPLPAKGVLILFEGGRKDSFLLGSPLLEKKGFIATMTVPTAFLESPSNFYLKKGDLKRLSRSPYWRLASMGHEAYKKNHRLPRSTRPLLDGPIGLAFGPGRRSRPSWRGSPGITEEPPPY